MRRMLMLAAALVVLVAPLTIVHAAGAEMKVLSPMAGEQILGNAVRVVFEVSGLKIVPSTVPLEAAGKRPEANRPGEGHLHLMLDLQPLVIWDKAEP